MTAPSGTFTCAVCRRTFDKERTDEEADLELEAMFGTTRDDTLCYTICDDCFHERFM